MANMGKAMVNREQDMTQLPRRKGGNRFDNRECQSVSESNLGQIALAQNTWGYSFSRVF